MQVCLMLLQLAASNSTFPMQMNSLEQGQRCRRRNKILLELKYLGESIMCLRSLARSARTPATDFILRILRLDKGHRARVFYNCREFRTLGNQSSVFRHS